MASRNIKGTGSDEAFALAAQIMADMGSGLKTLELYDASVKVGGRMTGFRAVVTPTAPVHHDLGLDDVALTTGLFELSPTQDEDPIDDTMFAGRIEALAMAVPDESEEAFGAHLLINEGATWIKDNTAVPTLASVGRVAIVSDENKNSDGEMDPRYFVRVTVASNTLTQQANDHHTKAVVEGRTYGQLTQEAAEEIDGTTSDKVFGSMSTGFPLAAAVMARAAQSAAESVADALGLEFANTKFDAISERSRPRSSLHQVTNIMRPLENGDIEILAGVVQPKKDTFLFDFGGTSSSVKVTGSTQKYVSVTPGPPVDVKFEADYGNRSTSSRKRLDAKWTWQGKVSGIGCPLLDSPARGYNQEKAIREQMWGGKVISLDNKLGKVATHNLLDRPITVQDLL